MGRRPKTDTQEARRPQMTHMIVGGTVPLEGIGYVLAAMYEHGAVHFEHQPVAPFPPAQGVTPGLSHEEVLRLPSPKKKPQKLDGNIVETCAEVVRAGHGEPVHTRVIGAGMIKAGFSRSSTSGAIQRAMQQGLIKRAGTALYLPGKARKDAVGREPKGGGESQQAVVAKTIERAYPKWVPRAKLLKVFEKRGWRPESSSVATSKLKADGAIIFGDTEETKGTYQWVPEEKRRIQPENPPADAQ